MEETEIIKSIMQIRHIIHTEDIWNSPLRISELMMKLEVWNNYLSDLIAPAHKAATEAAYNRFKENEHKGVTKAKEDSKGLSVNERERYERLRFLNSATSDLKNTMQTRLRVIENSAKGVF